MVGGLLNLLMHILPVPVSAVPTACAARLCLCHRQETAHPWAGGVWPEGVWACGRVSAEPWEPGPRGTLACCLPPSGLSSPWDRKARTAAVEAPRPTRVLSTDLEPTAPVLAGGAVFCHK